MSLDPATGVSSNLYQGELVNMSAQEAQAWKNAKKGLTTRIHYHTFLQPCKGNKHEDIGPEDLKEDDD